ncbi:hypothetical protein EDB81DRAFT_831165 [Dactylonectria macrodidyma]|uniref:Uncharacterized protein n=1 Tax=Dactylonectria macrodidyma TaxID=307937 RepID=A0A9P9D203_9HYPO|nr:hypothetical protein EDB81DRAFT_831165 [Dactylonectria macrodidyma]
MPARLRARVLDYFALVSIGSLLRQTECSRRPTHRRKEQRSRGCPHVLESVQNAMRGRKFGSKSNPDSPPRCHSACGPPRRSHQGRQAKQQSR